MMMHQGICWPVHNSQKTELLIFHMIDGVFEFISYEITILIHWLPYVSIDTSDLQSILTDSFTGMPKERNTMKSIAFSIEHLTFNEIHELTFTFRL